MNKQLEFIEINEHHIANGTISNDGKSIVYTCNKCPGWSRIINLVTGHMTTTENDRYFYIGHSAHLSSEIHFTMKETVVTLPVSGKSDTFSINCNVKKNSNLSNIWRYTFN